MRVSFRNRYNPKSHLLRQLQHVVLDLPHKALLFQYRSQELPRPVLMCKLVLMDVRQYLLMFQRLTRNVQHRVLHVGEEIPGMEQRIQISFTLSYILCMHLLSSRETKAIVKECDIRRTGKQTTYLHVVCVIIKRTTTQHSIIIIYRRQVKTPFFNITAHII